MISPQSVIVPSPMIHPGNTLMTHCGIIKETVKRTSQYNQDTAFDFQAANSEKLTKHFFRPLDTSLRRVSIEEVLAPGGTVSSNHHEISLRFL